MYSTRATSLPSASLRSIISPAPAHPSSIALPWADNNIGYSPHHLADSLRSCCIFQPSISSFTFFLPTTLYILETLHDITFYDLIKTQKGCGTRLVSRPGASLHQQQHLYAVPDTCQPPSAVDILSSTLAPAFTLSASTSTQLSINWHTSIRTIDAIYDTIALLFMSHTLFNVFHFIISLDVFYFLHAHYAFLFPFYAFPIYFLQLFPHRSHLGLSVALPFLQLSLSHHCND